MKKCINNATGNFIAILEGDDYWNSNLKLQKQLDFLDKHHECIMVFSKHMALDDEKQTTHFVEFQDQLPPVLDGNDFLNYNNLNIIINFSCCMFRKEGLNDLPDILFSKHRFSEITLAMYLEKKGFIGYLNEVLSVYRRHANGTWFGQTDEQKTIDALKIRMIAKEVCADKYKDKIQRLIDTVYIPKLLDNKINLNSQNLIKVLKADKIYRTKDIIIQRLPVRYKLLNSVIENRYKLWYNTPH